MTDKTLEQRAREFAKFWCAKNGKNSRHVRIAFAVDFAKEVEQPRPKLEKVRNGLESARHRLCCLTSEVFTSSFTDRYKDGPACEKTLVAVQAALAELDAAEKGEEG